MTMTLPTTRDEQLSQLLGCTVEQLDISAEDFLAAEQRYHDLAKHLAEYGADVYVQGSVMLGTVVSPYGRIGEFDLDLVCRLNLAKTSITQQGLKERVGGYLTDYIDATDGVDDEIPELSESRRAWALNYRRFHMDVLPAIPNLNSGSPTAILLTDKLLREWQDSDPKAYVAWFRRQCALQFELAREALAKSAAGTVDDVPLWRVRTPLHRVVQILKRHRDIFFANDEENRTPSSLITTLAALSYHGEGDLLHATMSVVQRMPLHIEKRNGKFWVPNPVADENFADKWNDYPQRRARFIEWAYQVEKDLEAAAAETSGVQAVRERLEKAFGPDPVRKAFGSIADQARNVQQRGALRVTSTGLLTTGAGIPSRPHRFFGGPTN
jgi:hypothetical protein